MLFDKGAFKYHIGTFRGGGLSQNADAGYAGRGRDEGRDTANEEDWSQIWENVLLSYFSAP